MDGVRDPAGVVHGCVEPFNRGRDWRSRNHHPMNTSKGAIVGMNSSPVSVELKYGVPGVLVTSGIALLALSAINAALFSIGISLLLLGILGFIVKQIFHDLDQINPDEMEPGGKALFALYIIMLIFLAILV